MEKITFCPEGEEPVEFYVLEQTKIGGVCYLLVTETEEGDSDAYVMKDLSKPEDKESIYEIVTEEKELSAVVEMFESLLDNVEFVEGE